MSSEASLTTGELLRLREALTANATGSPAIDDADRIERVRLFEEIKAAAAAAQAAEAVAFDVSQRAGQASRGGAAPRQGRGVASQLALARRVSPHQGQRWLGNARLLSAELPGTFTALAAGTTSERRAFLVARETVFLSKEDRLEVDAVLAPHLEGWGDRRVEAEARKAAYRADPAGLVERRRRAEADRHVSARPAPETMMRLTALLPVAHGVACLRHPLPRGRHCTPTPTGSAAGS